MKYPKNVTVDGAKYRLKHDRKQITDAISEGPFYVTKPDDGFLYMPNLGFVEGMETTPTYMHRIRP